MPGADLDRLGESAQKVPPHIMPILAQHKAWKLQGFIISAVKIGDIEAMINLVKTGAVVPDWSAKDAQGHSA